ncbi:MAG: N-acetylneuraminate synthase family protein [Rubrivivax sp.]
MLPEVRRAFGRPLIVSTGMSTLADIEAALGVIAFALTQPGLPQSRAECDAARASQSGLALLSERVTLLHCVTQYSAPPAAVNLRAMDTLAAAFGLLRATWTTTGIEVALAAARGARVLEKHFTLDRKLPGPDHAASLELHELRQLVAGVRTVQAALGNGIKAPAEAELGNLAIARRAVVAARPIRRGEVLALEALAFKRPAHGLSPIDVWSVLGRPRATTPPTRRSSRERPARHRHRRRRPRLRGRRCVARRRRAGARLRRRGQVAPRATAGRLARARRRRERLVRHAPEHVRLANGIGAPATPAIPARPPKAPRANACSAASRLRADLRRAPSERHRPGRARRWTRAARSRWPAAWCNPAPASPRRHRQHPRGGRARRGRRRLPAHVAPGAVLCGNVVLGHGVHVGAGAVVRQACASPRAPSSASAPRWCAIAAAAPGSACRHGNGRARREELGTGAHRPAGQPARGAGRHRPHRQPDGAGRRWRAAPARHAE